MLVLLTSTASVWGQLITVLLIFVFVLAITAFTTKWIGNYQKEKTPGENIVVLETKRIQQNAVIEIVRIGDRYFAIAVSKDNVTMLTELSKDSLQYPDNPVNNFTFKDFLNKAKDNGENN